MPITIDGTGSISGLSAGGLPDLSVTTADIAAGAVTAPKLDGAQSGSAPAYAARAWVNFNGTGTVAIRASGNVTSITDNNVGDYTVNFTTAMPSANYTAIAITKNADTTTATRWYPVQPCAYATGSVRLLSVGPTSGTNTDPTAFDAAIVNLVVLQ